MAAISCTGSGTQLLHLWTQFIGDKSLVLSIMEDQWVVAFSFATLFISPIVWYFAGVKGMLQEFADRVFAKATRRKAARNASGTQVYDSASVKFVFILVELLCNTAIRYSTGDIPLERQLDGHRLDRMNDQWGRR